MEEMKGNPHVGPAVNLAKRASEAPLGDGSGYYNAQAQVAATLALVFELRTANLIAFEQLSQRAYDSRMHARIGGRLGLS